METRYSHIRSIKPRWGPHQRRDHAIRCRHRQARNSGSRVGAADSRGATGHERGHGRTPGWSALAGVTQVAVGPCGRRGAATITTVEPSACGTGANALKIRPAAAWQACRGPRSVRSKGARVGGSWPHGFWCVGRIAEGRPSRTYEDARTPVVAVPGYGHRWPRPVSSVACRIDRLGCW